MKITKNALRQIIREEVSRVLSEQVDLSDPETRAKFKRMQRSSMRGRVPTVLRRDNKDLEVVVGVMGFLYKGDIPGLKGFQISVPEIREVLAHVKPYRSGGEKYNRLEDLRVEELMKGAPPALEKVLKAYTMMFEEPGTNRNTAMNASKKSIFKLDRPTEEAVDQSDLVTFISRQYKLPPGHVQLEGDELKVKFSTDKILSRGKAEEKIESDLIPYLRKNGYPNAKHTGIDSTTVIKLGDKPAS